MEENTDGDMDGNTEGNIEENTDGDMGGDTDGTDGYGWQHRWQY